MTVVTVNPPKHCENEKMTVMISNLIQGSAPARQRAFCLSQYIMSSPLMVPIRFNRYGPRGRRDHSPHGVVGRVNTGFRGKKSKGRMTKSCHITGMTGQSSARGTW